MTLARAAIAVLVAAAALAACTNGIVTYRSEGAGNPSAQTYAPYAAMNGTILLVVRDNPFPNDRTNEAVLAVVNTHNPAQRYRFSLTMPPDWNGYTVVLGFGEAPVGNQSLCQNALLPLRPMPPGRMAIIADLCYGQQLVTEAYGHSPAVGGPDDPTFQSLVSQVMTELFAERRIFEDRGSRLSPFRF
ncbi:MAG TPA: hypothetical protein VGB82_16825 [Alphaproteobacteria bacterium]